VVPMVEALAQNVSSRLNMTHLGWVVADDRIHQANCAGYPILLDRRNRQRLNAEPVDKVMAELEALQSSVLGIKRHRPERPRANAPLERPVHEDLLSGQLSTLRTMFNDRRKDTVRENFAYIVYRALGLMAPHMASTEFGTTAVATPEQLQKWFLGRQLSRSADSA
jgi:hypothetical protein